MAVSGTKVARKEASKDQLVEHLKEHHDASVKHTELHHAHAALASKHEHNEGLSHAHHEASDYHLKAAHFHNRAFNAACAHHSDYDAYASKAHQVSKVANDLSSRAHKAGGDHAFLELEDIAAKKVTETNFHKHLTAHGYKLKHSEEADEVKEHIYEHPTYNKIHVTHTGNKVHWQKLGRHLQQGIPHRISKGDGTKSLLGTLKDESRKHSQRDRLKSALKTK